MNKSEDQEMDTDELSEEEVLALSSGKNNSSSYPNQLLDIHQQSSKVQLF